MKVLNLCPHSVEIFPESAFLGLTEIKPGVWVADSVNESALIVSYAQAGLARISSKVVSIPNPLGMAFETVKTEYGDLVVTGFDQPLESIEPDDVLIVSLPTQSMSISAGNIFARQMWSPYKVVRLASDTSKVLGCLGLSRQ